MEQRSPSPCRGRRSVHRILLVDDEPDVRFMLKTLLELQSYRVDAVDTGEGGLDEARMNPPDLMLLDLTLPGMSGIDVLRSMGADPSLSRIPVLVLTASVDRGIEETCIAAGASGFSTKLTKPPQLLAKIRNLLNGDGSVDA